MLKNGTVLLLKNGCKVVVDSSLCGSYGVRVLFKPKSVEDRNWNIGEHNALLGCDGLWKGGAWGKDFDVVKILRKSIKTVAHNRNGGLRIKRREESIYLK